MFKKVFRKSSAGGGKTFPSPSPAGEGRHRRASGGSRFWAASLSLSAVPAQALRTSEPREGFRRSENCDIPPDPVLGGESSRTASSARGGTPGAARRCLSGRDKEETAPDVEAEASAGLLGDEELLSFQGTPRLGA